MNQVWTKIKQHYLQPETDGEAQRKAALLSLMLHAAIAGAMLAAVLPLFLHSPHLGRDYALLGFIAAAIVGLFRLLRRRYVRATSWGWTLLLWGSTTVTLWTSEGFRSGIAYGYFLVMIVASLLLSRREVLLFGGLCFLSNTGFFYYQQWRGLLDPERLPVTQAHWVFLNTILTVAIFLLAAAADNITNAFRQARDNAQALEEKTQTLHAYAGRLEIQHEIDHDILAAQSLRAIAQAALAHSQPLIPNLLSSVMLFNLEKQQMETLAAYANEQQVIELEGTFVELMHFNTVKLGAGEVNYTPDMSQDIERSPLYQYFYDMGMRSYINVPLLAEGKLIGTLNFGADSPHFFTDTHLEIAREIATSLAVAMCHAQLDEQVQQDAALQSHLLEEINHRVGNNLTAIIGLLHVERRFIPGGETQQKIGPILERLEQRVTALAEVHKMLSGNSWTPVSLQELIERLIRQMLSDLPVENKFELKVAPTDLKISSRQANQLALVISELASNTITHAQIERADRRIDVSIAATDRSVEIIYRDNGPGYPEAVLREERFNVGLYLVERIVTATLHGRLELCNNDGAVAVIHFDKETLAT